MYGSAVTPRELSYSGVGSAAIQIAAGHRVKLTAGSKLKAAVK